MPVKSEKNLYSVQKKQWAKWRENQRHVFNEVYGSMAANPEFFLHRKQVAPSRRDWLVTCWNAAWVAADAARYDAPDVVVDLKTGVEHRMLRLKAA